MLLLYESIQTAVNVYMAVITLNAKEHNQKYLSTNAPPSYILKQQAPFGYTIPPQQFK